MARIRTIKPEFFTSEDIVGLSPFARLLYIALWCEADKEGRLVWKPKTFKMRYLPGDDLDILALCKELTDARLVVLYGDGLAYIPAFKSHQHINPRESDSQLPAPDASTTRAPRVSTRQSPDSDAQGGREGKGKEGTRDASRHASDVPPGFERFWQAWPRSPRKEARGECLKAWQKAKAEPAADLVVAHVERLKASPGWSKQGGEFIPAPLVYLNQRRWEGAEDGGESDTPSLLAGAV
jgi:hypothetical protein